MFSTKFVTVLLHLDSQGLKFLENVKGIAEKHPKGYIVDPTIRNIIQDLNTREE